MSGIWRAALLGLLLVLSSACHATDALILIRHERAGPNLPSADFEHPDWFLWPAVQLANSENGFLSICTGLDWLGKPQDLAFQPVQGHRWHARNQDSLRQRGYFLRREQFLGSDRPTLVAGAKGTVDPESLLLSTGGTGVIEAFPATGLAHANWLVFEAQSWDDVARLARRAGGRSLIMEFPPQPGTLWTRFWRFGPGWPDESLSPIDPDLHVAGLIPARSAYQLLRHPDRFSWAPNRVTTFGGPNRWLEHQRDVFPFLGAALLLAVAFVAAIALHAVAQERNAPIARMALLAVLIFPAADVLSMTMASQTGLSAWPIELALTELLLTIGAFGLGLVVKRGRASGVFVLGSLILTTLGPNWSDFSPSFRWPQGHPSPELTAVWIGYLAGALTVFGEWGKWRFAIFGVLYSILLGVSVFANPWWMQDGDSSIALVAIPFASALGFSKRIFLFALLVLPTSVFVLVGGFTWSPYHLLGQLSDLGRFDTADWVRAIMSPGVLGAAFFGTALALFTDRFVAYRLKAQWLRERRLQVLPQAAAGLACFGVLQPVYLPGSVLLIGAGLLVLLVENL